MSIRVTTDVVCDRCGGWREGTTSTKAKKREARRIAKNAGWVRRDQPPGSGRYVDLCPTCADGVTLEDD